MLFDETKCFEDICGMSVSGVDDDHVYVCFYQRIDTIEHVCRDADCGTAEQTSLLILGGQWVLDGFLDIFDGDQTFEVEIVIDNRKFFFSGFCKDCFCLVQRNAYFCSDQVFAGHGLFDFLGEISFKLQITVCNNTNQFSVLGNRDTGNTEFCHPIIGIFQGVLRRQIERIGDNTVLRTFYFVYFFCLLLNRHILVNNTDSSLTCHGNCHTVFCNRIHAGAHHRDVQLDLLGQMRSQIYHVWGYFRILRNQKHIIEGNTITNNCTHFHFFLSS